MDVNFFNNIYYSGHPNGGRPMPYCLALPALPYPRQFNILLRIFLIMEEPFHPAAEEEHGRRGKSTCKMSAGTTTFLLTRRPLFPRTALYLLTAESPNSRLWSHWPLPHQQRGWRGHAALGFDWQCWGSHQLLHIGIGQGVKTSKTQRYGYNINTHSNYEG